MAGAARLCKLGVSARYPKALGSCTATTLRTALMVDGEKGNRSVPVSELSVVIPCKSVGGAATRSPVSSSAGLVAQNDELHDLVVACGEVKVEL